MRWEPSGVQNFWKMTRRLYREANIRKYSIRAKEKRRIYAFLIIFPKCWIPFDFHHIFITRDDIELYALFLSTTQPFILFSYTVLSLLFLERENKKRNINAAKIILTVLFYPDNSHHAFVYLQGRKHPLDTPKRMIERRERERKVEGEI